MTYPGLGGQQPPPQNSSPAGQLVPGVQPGVTGQIVASRVVIIGSAGGLFVYSPSAGAGNLVASVSGQAGTDPFGNVYPEGFAAYVTITDKLVVQIGEGSFGGTPAAGLFTHDQTSPANDDPFIGAVGAGSSGTSAVLWSGLSTALANGAGIQATDSVGSGIPGGDLQLIGGTTTVQGNLDVAGTACLLTGHASVTAPSAAPSRTNLGATWDATTASQCNTNFVNIINALGALGLFT